MFNAENFFAVCCSGNAAEQTGHDKISEPYLDEREELARQCSGQLLRAEEKGNL